jgi:hypothetical protein
MKMRAADLHGFDLICRRKSLNLNYFPKEATMCLVRFLPLFLWLFLLAYPISLWADTGEEASTPKSEPLSDFDWDGIQKELVNGFDWRFKVLGFGLVQQPENSRLNPYNVWEINRYQTEIDLRPDLNLKFRSLELNVKPRLRAYGKWWEDGIKQGDSGADYDLFVNEWWARYMIKEDLFVSYGRENLQWGPSFLTSPSNPFNRDNGKNNPMLEVPGLDYARTVWMPAQNLSASFIANVARGEKQFYREFNRSYAVKLDYTGNKKYFSLIPAYSESDDFRLGFFGGLSVTDALLIYAEGNVNDWDAVQILVGQSYTLELGPTISLEYYYNEAGCTESIDRCFPPYGKSSPDDILIRRNYLMVQIAEGHIRDSFNVVLRWIYDIDDTSSRSVGILEYEFGKHAKVFAIGNLYLGNKDTEFGSLMNYSVFLGTEYNF